MLLRLCARLPSTINPRLPSLPCPSPVPQSTASLVSLSLAWRHPCPFAVEQLYGVNYSGREVEISGLRRSRSIRPTFLGHGSIDTYRRPTSASFLTFFLLSAGPAATQPAIQVHGRRVLRQDQGGVQFSAGAVPLVSTDGHTLFTPITTSRPGIAREKRATFPFATFDSLCFFFFFFFFSSYFCLKRGNARIRTAVSRIARICGEKKRSGNGRSCARSERTLYPANIVVRRIRNGSSRIYELRASQVSQTPGKTALAFFSSARARGDRNFSRCPTVLPVISFFLTLLSLATYGAYSIREERERERMRFPWFAVFSSLSLSLDSNLRTVFACVSRYVLSLFQAEARLREAG